MKSIAVPWVDTGHEITPEGLLVWIRRGQLLFLLITVMVLAITYPLFEPDRDWDSPERRPPVETTVSGPSQSVDITVSATPNYHGGN